MLELYKDKYIWQWCSHCDYATISCSEPECYASSCNGGGCNICSNDMHESLGSPEQPKTKKDYHGWLKRQFSTCIDAWSSHCKQKLHSSNPNDYIDCDGFRNLVKLGSPILPFLKNTIKYNDDSMDAPFGVSSLMHSILGKEFVIPEHLYGKTIEINNHCKTWLEGYILGLLNRTAIFDEDYTFLSELMS